MSKEETTYPWAMLYNLESQRGQRVVSERARPGRPRNPIPRTQTSMLLTDEEHRILRELTFKIQEQLDPAKVSRSQVLGLCMRIVKSLLDEHGLNEDVDDWHSLVSALDEMSKV